MKSIISSATSVVGKLANLGLSLGAAESCTGGMFAQVVTSVAGSSAVFHGAVVAYANHVKEGLLNVPRFTLDTHGAVSIPVAEAMALGAKKTLHVDVAVGITGIAGPGGGTPQKPVGTVCIAVAFKEKLISKTLHLTGDRETIRHLSVSHVLDEIDGLLTGAAVK